MHPFFLAIYWLGYIDAQVGLLLVATLVALSYSTKTWHFVAAGLPLGAMFLTKPQGAIFVYVLLLAAGLALIGRRVLGISPAGAALARRAPLLLIGPILFFVGFSIALAHEGDSIRDLAHSYSPSATAYVSQSLDANMPNIWYPVADALRSPGEPIYDVTRPTVVNTVADAVTLLLLVLVVLLILRRRDLGLPRVALFVFGVTAIVWPMTLTHVHENHLYFGALLAIVLLPIVRRPLFTAGVQGLLLLQFVNLAGLYGLGLSAFPGWTPMRWLMRAYAGDGARLAVVALSIACFVAVLVEFSRWARTDMLSARQSPPRPAPAP